MAYIYFNEETDQFHHDVEAYINGYVNLYEIQEVYPIQKVIAALQDAITRQIKEYEDYDGFNKMTMLSSKHILEITVEEEYPIAVYPEKWI